MNKDLLNQIPADEQPVASELNAITADMKISPDFQWKLETQLMDAYKTKSQLTSSWHKNLTASAGWAVLAICGIILLNWTIRSLAGNQPSVGGGVPDPAISFEDNVRQGNICAGPLAVAHNFSVSLTNQDKTGFIILDKQENIGELRSFAWSPQGQLAVVGNTTGTGNIYLTDSAGTQLQPVIPNSELGYLMDIAWSHDGKGLLAWSLQNNSIVYLVKADGTRVIERQLDMQIFATPQFAPDNRSIIFYGADSSSSTSLFQVLVDGSQSRIISDFVEDESSFAWSPDGSRLAYIEMDRDLGESRLVIETVATGGKVTAARLPIPKGSGSSIPDSANLNWSLD